MTPEVCGWGIIIFMFFIFLVFLIKEREWTRAALDYGILSIPVIQISAFLANPPRVSALPPLFIAWLIIVVLPTSRDYWAYTRWNTIPMYESMNKRSLWKKSIPIPILIVIGGILAIEGVWFLVDRWGLAFLWLWGVTHIVAILNSKLKRFAIVTTRYLPLISTVLYILQCGNYLSIVYGGSTLASWAITIKVKRQQTLEGLEKTD